MAYVQRSGLDVAVPLARFIEEDCLPGLDLDAEAFWSGAAQVFAAFPPENDHLLAERARLQEAVTAWHRAHPGPVTDFAQYEAFLREIGYLQDEPAPFEITTDNVDEEIAGLAGPQLVVPALNARYALNAANARWGSLYDALYGTDVLPGAPQGPGYDPVRGGQVIAWAKGFLDEIAPLETGSHAGVTAYQVVDGRLVPALKDPSLLAGFTGTPKHPDSLLLRHNELHVEILLDRTSPVGSADPAGVKDILLEAALTTIVDLEDSIAAVDVDDKVAAYRNWLGLMRLDLEETFEKGGAPMTRRLAGDKAVITPDLSRTVLPGRSVLLVRNVGHLMKTSALRLADESPAPEGILDAIVTSLIGLYDLRKTASPRNSRTGSIYIVKPKMHGPEEAAFTDRLFAAVEDMLGLARNTLKVGVMDEERRTSANLAACIKAVSGRIVFINTGFLDRTGDEIHTAMVAGPMIPKGEMKGADWIQAYESRNVLTGLACGLSGRAQIGKGMWAAPDRMADMMDQKMGHVLSGANTAWVPSPTAATLHAVHYHRADVFALRAGMARKPMPPLEDLLRLPLSQRPFSDEEVMRELENNAQGILGYVVRWIDQGIGCSKVPDINDIGLMEDRATLRISSQHIANWLLHGVCSLAQVEDAFARMAGKVDAQNGADPAYQPMTPGLDGLAFRTAKALVLEGISQPNGYTEPLLHQFRIEKKAQSTG